MKDNTFSTRGQSNFISERIRKKISDKTHFDKSIKRIDINKIIIAKTRRR